MTLKAPTECMFYMNNVRYSFGFSIQNQLIVNEYLNYFVNGKEVTIYKRKGLSFTTGDNFQGALDNCKNSLKENSLLLSCAVLFSKVNEIEAAHNFFRDKLVSYNVPSIIPNRQLSDTSFDQDNLVNYTYTDDWRNYSLYQLYKYKKVKDNFLQLLQDLGLNIKDVKVWRTKLKDLPFFLGVPEPIAS